MATNVRLVERFHPETEVIQITCFPSWRCAAGSAEFAIHGHEINYRSAHAKLNQANFVLASLYRTSESATVKAKHAVEVDNAQYKMVDFANTDHRAREVGGSRIAFICRAAMLK
jgi:hypothetical protein